MRVPLGDLAQFGVNKDLEGYNLPPQAWTDAKNVRLQDGKLVRFTGHVEALAGSPIQPFWNLHVLDSTASSHWIVAGLENVYDFSSSVYSLITNVGYTYLADQDRLWNGGQLGNIPIINNGSDVPQMWSPVSSSQRLVDLTNWPSTIRCAVIKPFKNYLFALDLTISGTRFGHRVRISHPAAPGAVPISWDPLDATKDVYENEVGDVDSGFLMDAEPMRDFMCLYKERSTHGAQFIGGKDKWRIFPIFSGIGAFQPACVVSFAENSMQAVMTGDDIVIHNGQTPQSILTERLRRWLVTNIDIANYKSSFLIHNQQEKEIWACIPLSGSAYPNLALIWNYSKNVLTFRELDQFTNIAGGMIPAASEGDWDSDDQSWDGDLTAWETFTHPPFIRRLLACKPLEQKLHHLDITDSFNGTNYTASIEKFGFDILGLTKTGQIVRDREAMRFVKRVYPQASGSPFFVQLGMQNEIEGDIEWSSPELFTPGVDKYVDFEEARATQLFGLRFFSTDPGGWEIAGVDIDVEPCGEF